MKTKLKPVKLSTKRPVAVLGNGHPVVPLNDRRLNFGNKWDYAPAPEDSKSYVIAPRHELFINGKFVAPHSGKHFDTINPATEDKLTEIALGDAEDVDIAVKAARRAYESVWSKMPGRERGKYLYRIARIIQEKIARTCRARNHGRRQAHQGNARRGFADRRRALFLSRRLGGQVAIRLPRPHAASARRGWADHSVEFSAADGRLENRARRSRAATPLSSSRPRPPASLLVRLAQIFQEAELPEGVVNVITGVGETGTAIVNHPDVNKIAFTGSTEIGKQLAQMIVGTDKRITLELGGKAANIVFEDAPIDQAIEGIIAGIYFNMGHVCCAGSRLLVQESIYPKVVKKLRDRIQTLRIGNPLDKNTDIGAINNKPQLEKIRELVQSGADEGAEVVQTRLQIAGTRLLVSADVSDRRDGVASRGAGGNFRAGVERDDVPHAGGSRRTREQHALRLERRRVDGQGQQDFQDRQPAPRRRRLGEHLQQVRPDESLRRLQGKRFWPRRRRAGTGGVLPVGLK